MAVTGLHILLTYRCTDRCSHCFVHASPQSRLTFSVQQLHHLFAQGSQIPSLQSVCFEGGEPFLYFPILLAGVGEAAAQGWRVGVVTNAYWAMSPQDAVVWLEPLVKAGLSSITVSNDHLHRNTAQAQHAQSAATTLGLACSVISTMPACRGSDKEQATDGNVMYRGRAAVALAHSAPQQPWNSFTTCRYETLGDPRRIHVDASGAVHLCQGLLMGNCWQQPLEQLLSSYQPQRHRIVSPLLEGGPAELARRYAYGCEPEYADACQLCYLVRNSLRQRFPDLLGPGQVYGDVDELADGIDSAVS